MVGETDGKRYEKGLKVPIIFSVTGHRDIPSAQCALVEERIVELFEDFHKKYPDTELILISPLADGGDRIAARAALRSGVKIAPILPSTEEKYKKTFGDANDQNSVKESVEEFEKIIRDKEWVFSPCILFNENLTQRPEGAGSVYRALSAHMIANSHIMIALWDGREYAEKSVAGGTYDTVRMAYRGIDQEVMYMAQPIPASESTKKSSPYRYLDITEDCLIFHIKTDRELSEEEMKKKGAIEPKQLMPPGTTGYIVPEMVSIESEEYEREADKGAFFRKKAKTDSNLERYKVMIGGQTIDASNDLPKYYHKIFLRMDEMNRDIAAQEKKNAAPTKMFGKKRSSEKERESKAYENMFGECTVDIDAGVMREMMLRKETVDELAMAYQVSSFRDIKISIALGVITTLFLQLYILFGATSVIILLYLFSLSAAMLFFWMHKRSERYQKFIEYRLLAESMRVCCYWSLIGINESVTSSCYGYMKNDTMWARCVLSAWESWFLNDYLQTESLSDETKRKIGQEWINGQKSYHNRKKTNNVWKATAARKIGFFLKVSSILLSTTALLLVFASLGGTVLSSLGEIAAGDIIFISSLNITYLVAIQMIIIGLSLATLIVIGTEDKLIHGGTGGQIEAKYRMFDIAGRRLDIMEEVAKPDEIDDVRLSVYYELGVQCINEVNDWAFEHKMKDINAPS